MAEPKKKTATKKTASSSKKVAPKKTTAKKTTTTAKKTTTAPVTKTVTKPAVKKVAPAKKAPIKSTLKTAPSASEKEFVPASASTKKSITDMSIFATILAVFVVALVVLGGYIYSRQARMMDDVPAPAPVVSEPQKINISSSVALTPEVMSALESLVSQTAIAPEEVLLDVRKIEDVALAQSESPDFFRDVQS